LIIATIFLSLDEDLRHRFSLYKKPEF